MALTRKTNKVVRSHKGKMVDIGAITARGAKVIAAGNMNINARGDTLGKGGKVVKTREQKFAEAAIKNGAKVSKTTKTSLNKPVNEMLTGKKDTTGMVTKKFAEQIAQPASDKSSLGKFQVGKNAETTGYKPNVDFKDPVVKK